ncbi:AAA family ATPase [Bradyrhizobium sp. CSS354]|uniref:AAA family ATPase n=1 Tax=Bradyrhizobium sp. CSS354 TaxID=2699172 RepID=UPI0023AEB12B|nr:AAA family ATPase [Bradyrhizobium sp. CSS354]MDE5460248.1 AAA family ATPase [Bradyrhizobium sp. CSS354]
MTTSDDSDDFDHTVEDDAASTGAAADSSDLDEELKKLPRLLRYALLSSKGEEHTQERLVGEINEVCPGLAETSAWIVTQTSAAGLELAAELDRRAVKQDEPALRSLSDCVRVFSLPLPCSAEFFDDYQRVGKALIASFGKVCHDADENLCAELEEFVFGWAALPACSDLVSRHGSAAAGAARLGPLTAEHRLTATKVALRRKLKEEEERRQQRDAETASTSELQKPLAPSAPERSVVVAQLSEQQMKNTKLKDVLGPFKGIVNVAMPLVEAPPLHVVRSALLFEFPYAAEVIDFALADLVGRPTVRLRPLLFVGESGGGKSRFARRLAELLGVNVWRTDASRADGAAFGGTDRRWYSAEPCHPFLAVAQGASANPLVIIDEIEKSATRNDYGRLWDCLLGFLEFETNSRYPDPALQTNLDLSHVSYVATANSVDPLPSPIRDRFRVVRFPNPTSADLDALLPAIIADLAKDRGLDTHWVPPLDGTEHIAAAQSWHGGSVRLLRRIVEAILRDRDANATRN